MGRRALRVRWVKQRNEGEGQAEGRKRVARKSLGGQDWRPGRRVLTGRAQAPQGV